MAKRKMPLEKLKKLILDSLCVYTYRQLSNNESFKAQTGIYTLGALSYWARKLGINDKLIFETSKEKGIIDPYISYEEWAKNTYRNNMYGKEKKRKATELAHNTSKLIELGNTVGCQFSENDTVDFMNMCLLDYFSQEEINNYLKG